MRRYGKEGNEKNLYIKNIGSMKIQSAYFGLLVPMNYSIIQLQY